MALSAGKTPERFEAMYYPYASIQNKETLKQSLLYFDKIHILSPEFSITDKSEELNQGGELFAELGRDQILDECPQPYQAAMERAWSDEEWKKFTEEFEPVTKAWKRKSRSKRIIISLINPTDIYGRHYNEFVESVKADLKDDNFKKLAQRKRWLLFVDKADAFIGNPEYSTKITLLKETFLHHQYQCIVDADLAESILINHAIYASIDKKLIPFTDEPEHSRLLTHKLQRNYNLLKDRLLEEGFIDDIKQDFLAKKVLETKLSGVTGVSFSDILNFRDDNKKELKSFRTEMGRLSTCITSEPWTPEFDSEVAQIIKSEIDPKVQDLNDQTEEFKDNMLVKYGAKAVPIAITIGTMVYAGIPLSLAVIGGTVISKLGKDNWDIFQDIFYDWKEWRHQKRNSMSYLFHLEKLG